MRQLGVKIALTPLIHSPSTSGLFIAKPRGNRISQSIQPAPIFIEFGIATRLVELSWSLGPCLTPLSVLVETTSAAETDNDIFDRQSSPWPLRTALQQVAAAAPLALVLPCLILENMNKKDKEE
jgi:hypothetical protein